MRCLAIYCFEQPDEVEFRKRSFISNAIKIDLCVIVFVDEKLCLYDPAIVIYQWLHGGDLFFVWLDVNEYMPKLWDLFLKRRLQ